MGVQRDIFWAYRHLRPCRIVGPLLSLSYLYLRACHLVIPLHPTYAHANLLFQPETRGRLANIHNPPYLGSTLRALPI